MPKENFQKLYEIVKKLRGFGGCPWDIEQTPETLRGSLIEETYECIEAIDEGKSPHICEELGDIFLLVVMISYMYEQKNEFSVSDVLDGVSKKLIRRHPHVFGDTQVKDSDEVLKNWVKIKIEQEGRKPKDSIIDEVSNALPPLDKAYKLQKKAAKAGFDWPSADGVFEKINEETNEVKEALADKKNSEVEDELGDLLFSVINLCRTLNVEPSVALQKTNVKFVRRYKYVEQKMKEIGKPLKKENNKDIDKFWEEAKRN
ncbi:nucleoside triphosphate pyrophosphohydrolase [Spirochaetia bacterium]|nr:nucleoside triphosphate pyrophosphohydrolase [Spirochaetia bacterium]